MTRLASNISLQSASISHLSPGKYLILKVLGFQTSLPSLSASHHNAIYKSLASGDKPTISSLVKNSGFMVLILAIFPK
jgi:hypothetical protein